MIYQHTKKVSITKRQHIVRARVRGMAKSDLYEKALAKLKTKQRVSEELTIHTHTHGRSRIEAEGGT